MLQAIQLHAEMSQNLVSSVVYSNLQYESNDTIIYLTQHHKTCLGKTTAFVAFSLDFIAYRQVINMHLVTACNLTLIMYLYNLLTRMYKRIYLANAIHVSDFVCSLCRRCHSPISCWLRSHCLVGRRQSTRWYGMPWTTASLSVTWRTLTHSVCTPETQQWWHQAKHCPITSITCYARQPLR